MIRRNLISSKVISPKVILSTKENKYLYNKNLFVCKIMNVAAYGFPDQHFRENGVPRFLPKVL